jgi:hypothetical protein
MTTETVELASDEHTRDNLAEVIEQIASEGPEGMAHPRALDAALDRILGDIDASFECHRRA